MSPPALAARGVEVVYPGGARALAGVDLEVAAGETAGRHRPRPGRQVLLWVRLPLAAPVIMAGVRTAAVITVGTATLAAFIGASGLGEPIITGLQLADNRRLLSGAVPAALLALAVDGCLALVERWLRPAGLATTPGGAGASPR